jgi:hypothetical protein
MNTPMRLLAFRIHNFRSIEDSGWIEVDRVTGLIGINESGKTNVLMPLWKLKPATGGAIEPIADFPRKRYHAMRNLIPKPVFIEARFELPIDLRKSISEQLRLSEAEVTDIVVKRDFDGRYHISWPDTERSLVVSKQKILEEVNKVQEEANSANSGVESTPTSIDIALQKARNKINSFNTTATLANLKSLHAELAVDISNEPPHSVLAARFVQLQQFVDNQIFNITDTQAVQDSIIQAIPPLVYYSNYGNLDSEIYLPHVIDNLQRTDLGPKEQAKVRTLKTLFDFVNLRPEEIKEMGEDINIPTSSNITTAQQEDIDRIAGAKKERDILLQSASSELTTQFREWWKQGQYQFRFAADGNHFRIWVSDEQRPEFIELESRSTGLQWFFSFYLVFLAESQDSHEGTILLLDEPGLTLHPLAQEDLSEFFENLSGANQLIYTAHSPFMVNADHLDRVRAVYTNKNGITRVSSDLQSGSDQPERSKSVYSAYAALGMSVSQILLLGCQPIIVEGTSDQYYMSAIKILLIGNGFLSPSREIVFVPAGGVKGVKAVCGLVMGRNDDLPFVLLDGDAAGLEFARSLKKNLYSGDQERVLHFSDVIAMSDCEVEDLFPPKFIARIVDRYLIKPSDVDEDFGDTLLSNEPIVPQIEVYAAKYSIELPHGWKVEVARRVKEQLLRSQDDVLSEYSTHVGKWQQLFSMFQPGYEESENRNTGVHPDRGNS